MEFRLLGSLEVVIDGASVDVGGTQPRTVLAMLLVAGGRMVLAESIIEALWGHDPPDSAAGTLQSYVSRLRRALVPGGARGEAAKVLAWDPPGYKLAIGAKALDAHRFEALADQGRGLLLAGDPEGARALLDDALGLWRGPALLEFAHLDFAWGFAAKLEEHRLVATEDRIDADLRLGRHAAVVGELGELVAAHPLREQLRHHLALALYRSGRQAEALRILDDARRTLRDQLGIDPGRPLVDLETAILNHHPALELAGDVSAAARGAGVDAEGGARPVVVSANGSAPAARAAEPVATPDVAPPGARLVGRDVELRQVMLALDEARTATRVVLVEGEPGIGKTRLVDEAATAAAARGAVVLWGRAFEGGAAPAFWPWLPPLRSLVGSLDTDAELAPQLASLAGATSGVDGAGAGPVTDRSRFELFDAVTGLIAQSTADQQLVLVLDDLQWADVASLELLSFVARQLVDRPVLLACTVRQLEVGRNDAVVEALAALSRAPGTRRIILRGLSDTATTELVEIASGQPVDTDVAAAIHERSEGNPFFATELARLVVAERGGADAARAGSPGGDVPSSVRDVVRRRIALLPDPTVAMLQVAAVTGRDVELDLLTAATGDDIDTVLDAIEPAVVHRLLSPLPDRPATLRFSHALVREVVADDVSAPRSARIHLSVADALESTAGDLDDAAEILAEHLWAAAAIGGGRRAAEALERAAAVAAQRYAFEAAEGMLERAVQLRRTATTALDIEAEVVATSRLLSIQRSIHGYASIADSPHLRRAKELAQRAGRSDVHARLLWAEWAAYDTRCDFDRSDAIAQQLHELGEKGDEPLARITGLASLGISRWHRGRVGEASTLLDEACRAAADAAVPTATLGLDLEVMLLPFPFARYLHVLTGDLDEPAGEAEFEALAAAAPDRYAVSLVQMFASAGAIVTGRAGWAERAARRGIDADPEGTFSFWGRGLHGYLAAALILQDRIDEGLTMIDLAIDRFVEAGGRTGVVVYKAARAAGLAAAGRIDAAADAVAAAYGELEAYGERFAEPLVLEADASMRHARGDDPAEVACVLAEAIALAGEQGSHGIARRVAATARRLGVPMTG